jgi:hypothetical protein
MPQGSNKITLNAEKQADLIALFHTSYATTDEIAKEFGVTSIWLRRRLKEWIPLPEYKARCRERKSQQFSGEGNPRYGAVISDEQKAKHRASYTGFKHSPETIEKMRQSKLGKPCPEHVKEFLRNRPGTWRNRKMSDEHRDRMSLTAIKRLAEGRQLHPYHKTLRGDYVTRVGTLERHDSSWELRRMKELDEAKLTWTKKHGVVIPYVDSKGQKRRYYPDFLVTDPATGQTWIEEVKGYETPLDLIKYAAARPFCRSRNWDFRVLNKSHFSQRRAG